jgi:hypothetical protein
MCTVHPWTELRIHSYQPDFLCRRLSVRKALSASKRSSQNTEHQIKMGLSDWIWLSVEWKLFKTYVCSRDAKSDIRHADVAVYTKIHVQRRGVTVRVPKV